MHTHSITAIATQDNYRTSYRQPTPSERGRAGDGMKEAIARLYERRGEHPNARPWSTLHDSIGYLCSIDEAPAVEAWITSIMVEAMHDVVNMSGHHVPIEVDSYIDTMWRSD